MRNLYGRPRGASRSMFTGFLCWFAVLFGGILPATATPLHWQLNGVTFNDGGKVFGGFDFDSSSGTYSNINITTTPGSLLGGAYYNSAAPYANPIANTSFYGVSTVPVVSGSTSTLNLTFASPLTSAGGTFGFSGASVEGTCASSTCASFTPIRTIATGTVTAISSSSPKRWYVIGVVFSDGAQAFGSFVYDSTSGIYSSILVTTTAGLVVPGTSYSVLSPAATPTGTISLVSASVVVPSNTTVLTLNLASGLGNGGGTFTLTGVTEGTCTDANCSTSNALRTAVVNVNGSLSTTQPPGYSAILPQIADGGGFLTEFIITNPTGAPITCRLSFWGDDGNPLFLSLNSAGPLPTYVVMVPGHATEFLSTPGIGAGVTGWGRAENVSDLGVIATYRLLRQSSPEAEATVPGTPASVGFAMAFDETAGFDTGFALANVSASDTVIENLYFYDTTGALIFNDSSHTLGPLQHESYLFSSRYAAQLSGKQGTVRVYYGVVGTPANGTIGLTGLGLRVNPGGTFTSLATTTIDEAEPIE